MRRTDLTQAYTVAIDRFLDARQKLDDDMFWNMFNQNDVIGLKSDAGKILCFARCYDLTMTYLLAKQDIKEKCANSEITHDERQELMCQVKRIKDAGKRLFNNMQNCNIYVNEPQLQHYKDFWNAFYNEQPLDSFSMTNMLKESLNEARDIFSQRDIAKIGDNVLGNACLQFSSADEFVKMAKLALDVENKHIYQLKTHLPNIDRLVQDVAEKYAMESKLTNQGFVTHYAFALDRDKNIRDKSVNAVERYVLSTPAIVNKIGQEYVHVGAFKNKVCTIPQQITYGHNKNVEMLIDSVRGIYEAEKGSSAIKNSMSKVLGFLMRDKTEPAMQKDIQDWEKALVARSKSKMPQEVLGRYNKQTPKDMALQMLIIDAKIENNAATEKDLKERQILSDAIKAFKDVAKSSMEDILYGQFEVISVVENFASHIRSYGLGIFDQARYTDLEKLNPYHGEGGMANLRLLTHMMAYGQQEWNSNPQAYVNAMDMIDSLFKDDVYMNRDWIESQDIDCFEITEKFER